MSRQKIIEDRKEYLEKLNTEREEEEGRRQEELIRQQLLAEQRRLEAERQERERLRQEAELRQVQARHLKEKVAQFSQTAIGQKVRRFFSLLMSVYEITQFCYLGYQKDGR